MLKLTDNTDNSAGCCQIVRSLAKSRCEWSPLKSSESCLDAIENADRVCIVLQTGLIAKLIQYQRNRYLFMKYYMKIYW